MARVIRKQEKRKRIGKDDVLPLKRENFIILGIGIAVIILGYLAMLGQPVEGFLPLVVAPILLVVGYCVIIPVGILFKKTYIGKAETETTRDTQQS
jgi:uncharacterized ion transporter superfamily protein YfcC